MYCHEYTGNVPSECIYGVLTELREIKRPRNVDWRCTTGSGAITQV